MIIKEVPNFFGLGGGMEFDTLCDDTMKWPTLSWKIFLGPFIIIGSTKIGRKKPICA